MSVRQGLGAIIAAAVLVVAVAVLVVRQSAAPRVASFAPRAPRARSLPSALAGPDTVTLDARDTDRWTYFSVGRRAVVAPRDTLAAPWDLALRRHHIRVGPGVLATKVDALAWDDLVQAPEEGLAPMPSSSPRQLDHPAFARWYDYSWISHLLLPARRIIVVRTREGRFAKVAILSYYCRGEPIAAGCLTLLTLYQGDGSRRFVGR